MRKEQEGAAPAAPAVPQQQDQSDELCETLKAAKHYIEAISETSGYGYARPANPHDFHPDADSCTEEEVAAHKAACEAFDKGEYQPSDESGWTGNMHILRAPWGIGTYTERDSHAAVIAAALGKLIAALAAPALQVIDAPRVEDELHTAIIGHCNDLSDCAAILDEDGRFKATAAEIRVAVTELRAAIALPIARQAQPTDRDGEKNA